MKNDTIKEAVERAVFHPADTTKVSILGCSIDVPGWDHRDYNSKADEIVAAVRQGLTELIKEREKEAYKLAFADGYVAGREAGIDLERKQYE